MTGDEIEAEDVISTKTSKKRAGHSDLRTDVGTPGEDLHGPEDDEDDEVTGDQAEDFSDDDFADGGHDSDLDMTTNQPQKDEIEMFLEQWPDVAKNYKVIKKIGEGTFSSVYKAVDLKYSEFDNSRWANKSGLATSDPDVVHVALKRIYVTSSAQRIQNELELLKELRHSDGIVPIITASRFQDQVVAVLPYFDNQEFRDYYLTIDMDDVRTYMRELLIAVRSVHEKNIIHRDIKPSNFLYNFAMGKGMLTDFGLAQKAERPPEDAYKDPKTGKQKPLLSVQRRARASLGALARPMISPSPFRQGGTRMLKHDTRPSRRANRAGTRGFRAPEVLFKVQHQTPVIDIWSCGVVLLCFFTKQFPLFQSNDDQDAIVEIATIFGSRSMSECAALHNIVWDTDVPSVPEDVEPNDVFKRICRKILEPAYAEELERIPEEGYDLLTALFALDPRERISANEALRHPFLAQRG